jgi:glycosyltransferase involved in cell wall biosynthesis
MRRRLGFSLDLTTIEHGGRCEKEQPEVGPKGEGVGTSESKDTEITEEVLTTDCTDEHGYFQGAQCHAQGTSAGASEPDSLTSKLADSPVSESLTRSASASAFLPATSHSPLATPAPPDVVFLAFGQIRDGKNLDLFLRAMTRLPENVKLLVAGKGDSESSRPAAYYQKLAQELGVAERCRWDIRRIPDEEVGDIFAACDVVLLTYSANFRSASGVLNAAVSARKPVLASCGGGPLKTVVEKYHLGVFVEPDDFEEIVRGASKFVPNSATVEMPAKDSGFSKLVPNYATDEPATRHSLLATPPPAWDRYECENSWEENARKVLEAFSESEGAGINY